MTAVSGGNFSSRQFRDIPRLTIDSVPQFRPQLHDHRALGISALLQRPAVKLKQIKHPLILLFTGNAHVPLLTESALTNWSHSRDIGTFVGKPARLFPVWRWGWVFSVPLKSPSSSQQGALWRRCWKLVSHPKPTAFLHLSQTSSGNMSHGSAMRRGWSKLSDCLECAHAEPNLSLPLGYLRDGTLGWSDCTEDKRGIDYSPTTDFVLLSMEEGRGRRRRRRRKWDVGLNAKLMGNLDLVFCLQDFTVWIRGRITCVFWQFFSFFKCMPWNPPCVLGWQSFRLVWSHENTPSCCIREKKVQGVFFFH